MALNRCAWCASVQKRLFEIVFVHTEADNDLYGGHICAMCYMDLKPSWPRHQPDERYFIKIASVEELPEYVQERMALVMLSRPYTYVRAAGVRTDSYALVQTRANP